jgi:hypothetical protein
MYASALSQTRRGRVHHENQHPWHAEDNLQLEADQRTRSAVARAISRRESTPGRCSAGRWRVPHCGVARPRPGSHWGTGYRPQSYPVGVAPVQDNAVIGGAGRVNPLTRVEHLKTQLCESNEAKAYTRCPQRTPPIGNHAGSGCRGDSPGSSGSPHARGALKLKQREIAG